MDKIEEIKKLAQLLKDGAISQDEFNRLKQNILTNSKKSNSDTLKDNIKSQKEISHKTNSQHVQREYSSRLIVNSGVGLQQKREKQQKHNQLLFRQIKIGAIFIGLALLVGSLITSIPSSSESNSSSTSQYAELHCLWCKKVQKSTNGDWLTYYEWTSDGISVNQFVDDIKYKCCSERCCRLYHSVSGE